ncbi:DUF397 domain-containing protein [Streptomyces sp. ISL-100]|uniref:DUF397 domain-containing protein n=1 Tax=Streptomyces sp. ISL-100 TaxID=2819173 RepID=UPI001BE5C3DB|nr:DUF397 domain-containing protein [Streptomyces sp. ISL-100]MBT2398124.1 DUF397 domain-containing protein [Streptomyces sp. ISL-100]
MSPLTWQKSSFSEAGADTCIEVAAAPPTHTPHLRESDDPGIVLTTTPAALRALLRGIKAGSGLAEGVGVRR